jgi:hypothetical protein
MASLRLLPSWQNSISRFIVARAFNLRADLTRSSAVVFSQPAIQLVLELVDLLFGVVPGSCTVVAIILIAIERQQGGDQNRYHYYDCGPHHSHCITLFQPALPNAGGRNLKTARP